MRRLTSALALLCLLVTTACVERAELASDATAPTSSSTSSSSSTVSPTTATPPPTLAPAEPCRDDGDAAPVPVGVLETLAPRVGDERFATLDVSLSVWVDGWGEVAARDADHPLLPASNQKLLTAMGALEVLGGEHRLTTTVVATAPPVGGRVDGDLVLVGGGDPTLRRKGAHSLEALAARVRDAGVREVTGDLLVDESRYDQRRAADGWLDWQRPGYVGSLSALVVEGNRYRGDPAFLADPAMGGAELFRTALAGTGVTVAGATVHGTVPPAGVAVAQLHSASVQALVERMLLQSDNVVAESLVKEIDAVRGGPGGTAGGLAAIHAALAARCIPVDGVDADGSGLSRANGRSAREWSAMLRAARGAPWFDVFLAALPVAGRSGTLAGRLLDASTTGNVRAKTGSIIPGRALSGYFSTAGGRSGVFSIVVNGADVARAQGAIDELVTAAAGIRG